MKFINIYLILSVLALLVCGCDNENDPVASENLGFTTIFGPDENADPIVKELYQKYGVWVRMDFTDQVEVTNGILGAEVNRCTVVKILDEDRQNALTYISTLMSHVDPGFAKKYFPLEFFFVNKYVAGWPKELAPIGRSRLLITWPYLYGIEVNDPANYYYEDDGMTWQVWSEVASMITSRMAEPVADFANAGKAYDGGAARDQMWAEYEKDDDWEKVQATKQAICDAGGHISFSGSVSFEVDFAQWLTTVLTTSYDNIKAWYLDGGKTYQDKYNALIKFFNEEGWDIQAAGNLYQKKNDAYYESQDE